MGFRGLLIVREACTSFRSNRTSRLRSFSANAFDAIVSMKSGDRGGPLGTRTTISADYDSVAQIWMTFLCVAAFAEKVKASRAFLAAMLPRTLDD